MEKIFSIGMTKQAVLSKLDGTKASAKTKQSIQNFWKTDEDGKITNEIELAMLDSWANGSEKVKMPTRGEKEISKDVLRDSEYETITHEYTSGSGKGDVFVSCKDFCEKKIIQHTVFWNRYGSEYHDYLTDNDGDGYADNRMISKGVDFKEIELP